MRKKKIAIIHNILNPHIIPLFEKLYQEKDYDFKFFFASESESNRLWKTEVNKKFDYKILPKIALEFRGKDLFTYFINPTIIFELIKYNPDVIIVGGWDIFAYQIAFLYAKLFRKKFILRSGSTKYEKSWRRTISKPLVRLMIRGADALIVYGTRAKEYLISLGAKSKKIFIAYNTIDIESFQKELKKWKNQKREVKEEIGIETEKVILFVGQLIERKGVIHLIKTFRKLKKGIAGVGLLIVGHGQQERELKELVKKDKIKDVCFYGGADWPEVAKFYAIADLFVLPSTEEVWGLVINEAMAAGLPVITTDRVGASVDLVEEGKNGAVVKSGDIHELSLAMKKILRNPKILVEMSKESERKIGTFNLDAQTKGALKAINFVLR
jgi:glycosyltransferase involved in cell wall biosynthesis